MTSMTHDTDQTTESVTEISHRPWCNKHYTGADFEGDPNCCRWESQMEGGAYVNVEASSFVGCGDSVTVWGNDSELTPEAAIDLAATIVQGASLARGDGQTTARVLGALAHAVASHGPIDLDDLETILNLLSERDLADVFSWVPGRPLRTSDIS